MKRILPFASASLLAASMMIAPALAQDKQQQDSASGAASGDVQGSGSAGVSDRNAAGQQTTGSTSQDASSERKTDQQADTGASRDQGQQTGTESSGQNQQAGAESGKQDRQAGEKQDMKAGAEQSGDQNRQAESGSASGARDSAQTQGTSNETTASINITNEQQTELHTVFTETEVQPAEEAGFDINVGVAVPDTITLHPLPPRVVTIVPAYEGYEYFVLPDGRIIIVQPDTLEIVYVLS